MFDVRGGLSEVGQAMEAMDDELRSLTKDFLTAMRDDKQTAQRRSHS